jgi:His/Glu/Gln/Arg/opine family amino acid ABC transporter permease subunit
VSEFSLLLQYLPVLGKGALITLQLSVVAIVVGTLVGVPMGLMRRSSSRALRLVAATYVDLFRSIPILIQLYFFYYALPLLLSVEVPKFPAAVGALGLYSGSFMAEVVRGGVDSVAKGQWEAAYSLGLRHRTVLARVVLPQALRVAIPPAISIYVFTLKDSSLVSVIGYFDLTGVGVAIRESFAGRSTFLVLLAVAATYFAMAFSISIAGQSIGRRLRA